ncbi:MAG: hypothetical protein GW947_00370 [Candidatus Pacebacteria bacterium]|nr:hypothetical protein [Candidatus Paceibacterota bacterium]PIR61198.1 MAG: hypothetical protein COU68_00665 [Candidatus Pacebacteria bacterium CG10_big_fil_rev_8_21_14_0_10_45_6]
MQEPAIQNEPIVDQEAIGNNIDIVANNLATRLQARAENAAQPSQNHSVREIMGRFPTLPAFRDMGFFDIQLDIDAFAMLFEELGLQDKAAQFSILVTSGQISDLDFYGNVVGGITNSNGDIVVYSSIPHHAIATPGETLQKNNWSNMAFRNDVLLNTILHELRHTWQTRVDKQNLSGSMAASEHDSLATEQDAIAFAERITPIMQKFLQVNGVHQGFDTTPVTQVDPVLAPLVDLAQDSVLVINDEVNNFNNWHEAQLLKAEQGTLSSDEISHYCEEAMKKLQTDKIGFIEWKYLLRKLQGIIKELKPEDASFIDQQLRTFDQEVAAQNT